MSRPFDRKKIKTLSLKKREHKMSIKDLRELGDDFNNHKNAELDLLVEAVLKARKNHRPVILSMGAHPIRTGNSRLIIDLMEKGLITHISATDAVPIHDFELSYAGGTLEDVEKYVKDGSFGHWEEPGRAINFAARLGARKGLGLGEAIGKMMAEESVYRLPYKNVSVFAAAYQLKIPITVHKLIGGVITDQHPEADFAALGKTSGRDFLIFAHSISGLEGGVYLCWGSKVVGPEIYLKALSMARNGARRKGNKIKKFTTAVFDNHELGNWRKEKEIVNYRNKKTMEDERYYYRPLKTILIRTVKDGGKSYYIKGDFSQTIPAFYAKITGKLVKKSSKP